MLFFVFLLYLCIFKHQLTVRNFSPYVKIWLFFFGFFLCGISIAKYSRLSLRRTTWDRHYVSVLERCLSYRDTTQWSKERQGTTLGVRFIEVLVIWPRLHWLKSNLMCLFLQYDAEQESSQSESDSSADENDVEGDEVIWVVSLILVVHSHFSIIVVYG